VQAIKTLRAGPLHNHLVRERPKTVSELYEQFEKISKSEVQHFHKLEQQRKTSKPDEALRPPRYNDSQRNYPKLVHNIDSDDCGPPDNWEKNFGPPPQERNLRAFDQTFTQYNQRGGAPNRSHGRGRDPYTFRPPYCMFHKGEAIITQKIAPYFSCPKEKWNKNLCSLHSKQHLEKLTTPCNGLPTTSNILHLIIHIYQCKPTKTIKSKPRLIINLTTMP
jgi:hypothetical protein